MISIKKIIQRIYHLYLIHFDQFKYAQNLGVDVGAGTRFRGINIGAFSTEPYLIKIGKNCLITSEVRFITHDGSVYHLKYKFPKADLINKIVIGDNVFIGLRSIILSGTTIGNNVVIGAGSVVKGDIPSDTVVAGVPAKIICSLQDYLKKIEPHIENISHLSYKEKKEFLIKKFL